MLDGPDPLTTRTARQRIGGRWALAWQTYLITGALGLVAVLAGEAQSTGQSLPVGSWLVLGLAGSLAIGLVLLVFNATIFRHRRTTPLPIWVVVAADGFLGLVFSLVVGIGATILDVPTTVGLLERCILNMLYAMWWGPTLSYFMDLREQWITERTALIAESVRVEAASAQQAAFMARLQHEIDDELESELGPARERLESLRHALDSAGSGAKDRAIPAWDEAAQVLRGAVDDAVRPLSRKLWQQDLGSYPRQRSWSLLANIVRYQPFRPWALAVIDVLGTFSPSIRTFGAARGLTLLIGGLACSMLIMFAANALMRRFPARHSAIFIGGLIALQSVVLLRGEVRELWVPGSAPASWMITQVIAGLLVVLSTSGFGAWWDSRTQLRATLREELHEEQVRSMARSAQVALLARETSQVLHGAVQTRLMSCAMVIEQASASGDVERLTEALNEAIAILDQPMPSAPASQSIENEVGRKLALWEGLCSFEVSIASTALAAQTSSSVTIARVVEEGISNAIRHGRAAAIAITISRLDTTTIRVVIADNGLGPQGGGAGLGSAYLLQASAGRWSLRASEPGSRLEVLVSA